LLVVVPRSVAAASELSVFTGSAIAPAKGKVVVALDQIIRLTTLKKTGYAKTKRVRMPIPTANGRCIGGLGRGGKGRFREIV